VCGGERNSQSRKTQAQPPQPRLENPASNILREDGRPDLPGALASGASGKNFPALPLSSDASPQTVCPEVGLACFHKEQRRSQAKPPEAMRYHQESL
jgi:hypothetical protein